MKTLLLCLVCTVTTSVSFDAQASRRSKDKKSDTHEKKALDAGEKLEAEEPVVVVTKAPVTEEEDRSALLGKLHRLQETSGTTPNKFDSSTISTGFLLALLLLASVAAGAFYMKGKIQSPGMGSEFDVIASKTVAPRTRLLWLSAGPQELILAVSGKKVKCIAKWESKKNKTESIPVLEVPAEVPMLAPVRAVKPSPPKWEAPVVSSDSAQSLSGLFQLRDRKLAYESVDSDAEEQDAVWQRELASALEERTGSNF